MNEETKIFECGCFWESKSRLLGLHLFVLQPVVFVELSTYPSSKTRWMNNNVCVNICIYMCSIYMYTYVYIFIYPGWAWRQPNSVYGANLRVNLCDSRIC